MENKSAVGLQSNHALTALKRYFYSFWDVQTYRFENYIKNATKIYKKGNSKKLFPKKLAVG
jgi:hypothetical protein